MRPYIRARNLLNDTIYYDVLLSRDRVYDSSLNEIGPASDFTFTNCTGYKDVRGHYIWEGDLILTLVEKRGNKDPLKENVNFLWVQGVNIRGQFSKVCTVLYSHANMAYYLNPLEVPEMTFTLKSAFFFNLITGYSINCYKLGSPVNSLEEVYKKAKLIETNVKRKGIFSL